MQELTEQHQLSPADAARLKALAGVDAEPPALRNKVALGMALVASSLIGVGIIFWIAANWEALSRAGRFALLQALFVTMCAGAALRPAARQALGLLALLTIGALFAFFGQTYQTGADPWQLFALWAALAIPLCLAVRHDALWAPWALVAMSAVALWIHANAGHAWRAHGPDLPYHLAGWCMALLLVFALSPGLRRYTGAGPWSMRAAVTLSTFIITWSALAALFDEVLAPQYSAGLIVSAAAAGVLCTARFHDTYSLSAIALSLNVLLVAGLSRLLLDNSHSEPIGKVMLIGLFAAGLLAATVKLVMNVSRTHAHGGEA